MAPLQPSQFGSRAYRSDLVVKQRRQKVYINVSLVSQRHTLGDVYLHSLRQ